MNALEQWKNEKRRNLAATFEGAAAMARLPAYQTEYKFHPKRRFLADYAWPDRFVIVEAEGGIFGVGKPCPTCGHKKGGAHGSITGILRDIEKYNLAAECGFTVFRFGAKQKKNPYEFCAMIKRILNK